jgi:amino acid permease
MSNPLCPLIPSPGTLATDALTNRADQSFLVALLNLLNTLIGPEILSVPNSFVFGGVTVCIAVLIFAALVAYVSTVLILTLQRFLSADSINDLASKIAGRWCGHLFSLATLTLTYSNGISYLIIGADSITTWLRMAGLGSWGTGLRRSLVVLVYCLVVPVALTIPRRMDFINTASAFAGLAQILFVIAIIIRGANYFHSHTFNPTCETGIFNLGFFNAFSIYSTLFALPSLILPQLQPFTPHLKPRYILLGTGFVLCGVIIVVPSTIGYLMFGIDTDPIILKSFPDSDSLIQAVRVGFFFVVNAAYVIQSLEVMTDLSEMIYSSHDPTVLPWRERSICLLLTNLPPIVVAMFMPNVRPVFEIGGALGGCLSNYFFPAVLYLRYTENRWYHWKSLPLLALAAFGIIAAIVGMYQGVVDAIDALRNHYTA